MLGQLTPEEVETVLHSQLIGRIGCSNEDKVFVVPIAYAYDGMHIYGHSHEGTKIMMMRKHPKVCFEVDEMVNLTNWKSVVLWGTYEELKGKEHQKGMDLLIAKVRPLLASETMMPMMRQPEPHPPDAGIKAIAFRILVSEKTGRFEKSH